MVDFFCHTCNDGLGLKDLKDQNEHLRQINIIANKRVIKAQSRINKLEVENKTLKKELKVFKTFCKCKHPATGKK